MIMC
jgi:hypothetical protein